MKESVCVDEDADGRFAVKVSTAAFEFNVRIPKSDVVKLREAPATKWDDGALAIGTSAGASVFWCAGEIADTVSVLIGHDDQTWDIGLEISTKCLHAIVDELEVLNRSSRS